MRGSTLLPKQLRAWGATTQDGQPSWLNRQVTSTILSASHQACLHPIHTIVAIALLASTSYVGLLQQSLFDTATRPDHLQGLVDVDLLLDGGRTLELSAATSWKWQTVETSDLDSVNQVCSIPRSADEN